jgi:phosphoserine phosphatase
MKKIIYIILLLTTSPSFGDIRMIEVLNKIENIQQYLNAEPNPKLNNWSFDSQTTLVVFDLDNVLVQPNFYLKNSEIMGNLAKHSIKALMKLSLNAGTFIQLRNKVKKIKLEIPYSFVENEFVNIIDQLQSAGTPTIICTASIVKVNDSRISFLKKTGIDFSKPFINEEITQPFATHKGEILYGITSSQEKEQKIDEMVAAINEKRLEKNIPPITKVIFIDDKMSQIHRVVKGVTQVDEVLGLWYNHLQNTMQYMDLVKELQFLRANY